MCMENLYIEINDMIDTNNIQNNIGLLMEV
jgi:hypothetical protein